MVRRARAGCGELIGSSRYAEKNQGIGGRFGEGRMAGDFRRKGKSSQFAHDLSRRKVILSGKPGADALYYQEKQVRQAIREIPK